MVGSYSYPSFTVDEKRDSSITLHFDHKILTLHLCFHKTLLLSLFLLFWYVVEEEMAVETADYMMIDVLLRKY